MNKKEKMTGHLSSPDDVVSLYVHILFCDEAIVAVYIILSWIDTPRRSTNRDVPIRSRADTWTWQW
jgi:hypothetical protein